MSDHYCWSYSGYRPVTVRCLPPCGCQRVVPSNSLSARQETAAVLQTKRVKTVFPLSSFIALILRSASVEPKECFRDPFAPPSHRLAPLRQAL